jgi:hypothetical protein
MGLFKCSLCIALSLGGLACTSKDAGPPEAVGRTSQAESAAGYFAVIDAYLRQPPRSDWTEADQRVIAPRWLGDDDKGALLAPLYRGAFPGIEDLVWAPPDGDCSKRQLTVRIDWDSAANTVHYVVKGRHVDVNPTVTRTLGVDFFPDQFHNDPQSFDGGIYRLWTILASTNTTANFYYDATTLDLLGSEFDFSTPPPNAITQPFPVFSLMSSNPFVPDADGNVLHEYTLRYDAFTVEDGVFSRVLVTFIPLNLSHAAPLQPNISELRPYVSPWQPPGQALNFRDMLHAGLAFDTSLDPSAPPPPPGFGHNVPYAFAGVSYAGNVVALQGGVPGGQHFRIVTAIQSVAPTLDAVPGGNGTGCFGYVSEDHHTAPNFCQGGH